LRHSTLTRIRDQFKRFAYLHEVEWILDEIARRHGKKRSDTSNKDALSRTRDEKLDLLECMSNFARPSTLEADEKFKDFTETIDGAVVKQKERGIRTIRKKNEKFNKSKVALKKPKSG
jgi:hypothetical protein